MDEERQRDAGQAVDVIGAGYVGTVIAAYLARDGRRVTAVDTDPAVTDTEAWFTRYDDLAAHVDGAMLDRVTTTTDYDDVTGRNAIICVDTPVDADDSIDLSHITDACRRLGGRLQDGSTVIVRSTVPPGTSTGTLVPLLEEASGMTRGDGFVYGYAPEFLRGGTGMEDFIDPTKQVFAGDAAAVNVCRELFPDARHTFETGVAEAEAAKYMDNVFHGMKVAFANEVGRMGASWGFDAGTVMDVLTSDREQNLSPAYLDPGASFGGPCLVKDITALHDTAREAVDVPLLAAILESNTRHDDWVASVVADDGIETVGLVGLGYKPGCAALTHSPALRVAERLRDRGLAVVGHDPAVDDSPVEQVDADALTTEADALVVFHADGRAEAAVDEFDGPVLDLGAFQSSGL